MGLLTDLDVAIAVADHTAALALGYFESGVASTPKSDVLPVAVEGEGSHERCPV